MVLGRVEGALLINCALILNGIFQIDFSNLFDNCLDLVDQLSHFVMLCAAIFLTAIITGIRATYIYRFTPLRITWIECIIDHRLPDGWRVKYSPSITISFTLFIIVAPGSPWFKFLITHLFVVWILIVITLSRNFTRLILRLTNVVFFLVVQFLNLLLMLHFFIQNFYTEYTNNI